MSGEWISALKRHVRVVIALTAVGAGLGAGAALVSEEQYEASAVLSLLSNDDSSDVDDGYAEVLSRLAVRPEVTGPALAEAGYPEIARRPEEALSARAAPDAPVVEVTARAASPEEAAEIANAAAEAVEEFMARDGAGRSDFSAEILTGAFPPTDPSSLSLTLAILAGGALGFAVAVVVSLARGPSHGSREPVS